MKHPRVIAAAPIHNREYALKPYLKALMKTSADSRVFLANNCNENTLDMLDLVGNVHIFNDVKSAEERHVGNRIKSLAILRNRLLEIVFDHYNADYMFSVDSDIVVYPEIIEDLLKYEKDIVSCLVYNDLTSHRTTPNHAHIGNIMSVNAKGVFAHMKSVPSNTLVKVGMTGAVYLISKKVYEAGVRYTPNRQGEDCGFALQSIEKGFKQYCYTKLLRHIMTRACLTEEEKKEC